MVGEEPRRAVGRHLRARRKALNLSLRDFSRALKSEGVFVSESTISRIERGSQGIEFCAVDDWISHLGIPLGLLQEVIRSAKPKPKVPPGLPVQELLSRGRDLGLGGAFRDALAHFEEVEFRHSKNPDSVPPDDLAYALELQATVHAKLRNHFLANIAVQKIWSINGVSEDLITRCVFTQVLVNATWKEFRTAEIFARFGSERISQASPKTRFYGLHVLGNFYWRWKRFEKASPFLKEALEVLENSEKPADRLAVEISLAQCEWKINQEPHSIQSVQKATRDAFHLGFADIAAWGHRAIAEIFFELGKHEECRKEAQKSRAICKANQNSAHEFYSLFWIWKACKAQGDRAGVEIASKAMRGLLARIDQTDEEVMEFLEWRQAAAKEGH